MQVNVIDNVPGSEVRKCLRVATVTKEESSVFFLYIGNNESSIKFLLNTSSSGLIAENFHSARNLIRNEDFKSQGIDVIIIDMPLNCSELTSFNSFLQTSDSIGDSIPVIYNQQQLLLNDRTEISGMVDDIIDLSNWHYDFTTKVSFLKQARQYEAERKAINRSIKADNCLYKRTFDVVVSSLLILITLPLFLLIILAIKLESKGPVFYNAKRAGRGFRIFKFFKFRTMVMNADKKIDALAHLNQYAQTENGVKFFKIANDPRITKVGRVLRNTSLDELPQLFNVLKGDMSLVGNRPLPLYEAATLTTNDFVERFMAPAGITGLWQIKKRGQSDMSVEERINLDISYARKSNLMYDLWIMANTPAALLQKSDV
jgi:lipopolysaccharide/colanic/teichoic acid biosynthesis glycosyltransferase